jgi:UDP-N-acetylglucosamine 2-epimerase (non-hydrolysing)
LVHTGQHYDYFMSEVFFGDLGMPEPDRFLGTGGGSHAQQSAAIMSAIEPVLVERRPDWVVVVGDVNSTVAAALVAVKLGIAVAHVEAGLRSGDRSMPEEINRVVTDQISSLHFTPSEDADRNLMREGIARERIHFVGNVMIDSLVRILSMAAASGIMTQLDLKPGAYALCTFHRPGNVDTPRDLEEIMQALAVVGQRLPVVFPIHPRTRKALGELGTGGGGVHLIDPLGYSDFVSLMRSARLVITDSGGVQEETAFLNVPCLTVRPNTERPVTIARGTNRLVQGDRASIVAAVDRTLAEGRPEVAPLPLWDGFAARRIVDVFRAL